MTKANKLDHIIFTIYTYPMQHQKKQKRSYNIHHIYFLSYASSKQRVVTFLKSQKDRRFEA